MLLPESPHQTRSLTKNKFPNPKISIINRRANSIPYHQMVFEPRLSKSYRTGRYNRYMLYRSVNRYRNHLWNALLKILGYTRRTGEYRKFQPEKENRPVQKVKMKKKKESSNPLPIIACHHHFAAMLLSLTRMPSLFWNCPPRPPPPTFSLLFVFFVLCPPLLTSRVK